MDTNTLTRAHRTIILAALSVIVALVATLLFPATAEARTSIPRRTAVEIGMADAVANLLNSERGAHHLKPLTMRPELINSARAHDLAMARANTMSHQVQGEQSLGSRLTAAGYSWIWAGENIGWNSDMTTAGVLMLQKAMYDEVPPDDGHRLNILSPHFSNMGVDVYLDSANDKVWLTVDFGRP